MRYLTVIGFLFLIAPVVSGAQATVEIVGKAGRLILDEASTQEVLSDLTAHVRTCPIDSWNFPSALENTMAENTMDTLSVSPRLIVRYAVPLEMEMNFYTENPVTRRVTEVIRIDEVIFPFSEDYVAVPHIMDRGVMRILSDCSGGHGLVVLCRPVFLPYLVGRAARYCENTDWKRLRDQLRSPSE